MKKISFMGIALLSLMAAGMTSCSSDDSLSGDNNGGAGVTIKASIDEPASRVAFEEEGGKLKMYWKNAADVEKFSLHYTGASASNYMFVKAATTEAKSADFSCNNAPTVAANTTVFAIYPGVDTNLANATTVPFSLKDQPGTEATTNSTTKNVGDYNFMVASGFVPTGGLSNVSFSFVHKVALVKMVLTFPDDVTGNITNISINSAAMHNAATYDFSDWTYGDAQKGSVSTKSDATFTLTNHQVTAWLAVFPEALTGITITATAGNDTYSVGMSNVTFAANKVYKVAKTMAKVNFKSTYTISDYYMWDAYLPYQNITSGTWGTGSSWYNGITSGVASASCVNCPTANDMVKYITAVGTNGETACYWDDGSVTTGGTGYQTFITQKDETAVASSETQNNHTGLWILKKVYWNDATKNKTDVSAEVNNIATLSATDAANVRTSGKYFFLPAAGYYYSGSQKFQGTSVYGNYWSKMLADDAKAYVLHFTKGAASVGINLRIYGFLPMVAE